jgi:Protein of unknown function (DUF998)
MWRSETRSTRRSRVRVHEALIVTTMKACVRGLSDGTKVLLVGGVLSSLLYVIGIDVIAALAYPDYHNYADQMVSELFAVGAPTRTLMVWLSIPYNVLVFALAVGVWVSAGRKRATRFTAAALVGYGAVSTAGLLLFPMDVRGTVESQRDALHIIATIVMSMFIVAVMAFGAFAHGTRFRLYSFATIATVIVFGVWAGLLARPMPGPTPWLGLVERVNIYATMLWVAVLAVCFLRVQDRAGIRPIATTSAGWRGPARQTLARP